jgi:hypothetical protein
MEGIAQGIFFLALEMFPSNTFLTTKTPSLRVKALSELTGEAPALHVRALSEFNSYRPEQRAGGGPKADLLVELDEEGSPTGRFRWAVACSEPVGASFSANEMGLRLGAEEFDLAYYVRPEEITMRPNMTMRDWEYVGVLVAKRKILATQGGEDATQTFLGTACTSLRPEPCVPFSFRPEHWLCLLKTRLLFPLFISPGALAVSS